MFNLNGFEKKEEKLRSDRRSANVMPGLVGGIPVRPQAPEASNPARDFAEPPKMPTRTEAPAGSKLTVGPGIKLKGVEITDCDTLVVEGRVEASLDSRVVQIAEKGVFTGTATMDVAEIWGHFEGVLTVRQQLVIYATGCVSGSIRYGKVRIEEGGALFGEVSTLADAPATSSLLDLDFQERKVTGLKS